MKTSIVMKTLLHICRVRLRFLTTLTLSFVPNRDREREERNNSVHDNRNNRMETFSPLPFHIALRSSSSSSSSSPPFLLYGKCATIIEKLIRLR